MLKTTLCYLEKDGKYLMLYRNKKENDPCEGKWVGIGGKFEPGETPEQCLRREIREETGLELKSFTHHGIVHFKSNELPDEDMYLYSSTEFDGDLIDCNEGELKWISKEDVLSLNLWEGDKFFLEKMISGETNIEMTCVYEGDKCVRVYLNNKERET